MDLCLSNIHTHTHIMKKSLLTDCDDEATEEQEAVSEHGEAKHVIVRVYHRVSNDKECDEGKCSECLEKHQHTLYKDDQQSEEHGNGAFNG